MKNKPTPKTPKSVAKPQPAKGRIVQSDHKAKISPTGGMKGSLS